MADPATKEEIRALYNLNVNAAEEFLEFYKDLKNRYPEFNISLYSSYIKFCVLGQDFCMQAVDTATPTPRRVQWASIEETIQQHTKWNLAQLSVEKMRDRIP